MWKLSKIKIIVKYLKINGNMIYFDYSKFSYPPNHESTPGCKTVDLIMLNFDGNAIFFKPNVVT